VKTTPDPNIREGAGSRSKTQKVSSGFFGAGGVFVLIGDWNAESGSTDDWAAREAIRRWMPILLTSRGVEA